MPDTSASDPAAHPFAHPFAKFAEWFAEASATEPNDPNAMTVATCSTDGMPSARIVLLKDYDSRGFVFYTNKLSRKGMELTANANVALLFYWKLLHRQVRIEGVVQDVTETEADEYFNSRARISRLGAWASLQSQTLPARADLERRLAETEALYPDETVPRPPHWSGYRVVPTLIEFWQDMPFRLHDRSVFTRTGQGWATSKLYP